MAAAGMKASETWNKWEDGVRLTVRAWDTWRLSLSAGEN